MPRQHRSSVNTPPGRRKCRTPRRSRRSSLQTPATPPGLRSRRPRRNGSSEFSTAYLINRKYAKASDLSAPGTSVIVYNDGHMDGPLSRAAAINRLRLPSNQFASTMWAALEANTGTPVPACDSKPPFLPWGGTGSATITVSGGQPCGVGWHDTPGGPGGVTVLDCMSVSSPPSRGTLKPQDQHVIIFTPTPGYKGQDSFTLTMQEHNGGRSATLRVRVSATIQ
jgi:hypothetical protein